MGQIRCSYFATLVISSDNRPLISDTHTLETDVRTGKKKKVGESVLTTDPAHSSSREKSPERKSVDGCRTDVRNRFYSEVKHRDQRVGVTNFRGDGVRILKGPCFGTEEQMTASHGRERALAVSGDLRNPGSWLSKSHGRK